MIAKTSLYLLIPALFFLVVFAVSCASQGERPLGMTNGKLSPCPRRPNCISSEDDAGPSGIEPLPFTGTPEAAWVCLKRAIKGNGGNIEREGSDYIWATFKTRLFRFVDDIEFRMDVKDEVIHVRSASRVGYYDFGVNRRRVGALRQRFSQEQNQLANKSVEDIGAGRTGSSR
jgi:uncharacterized protein (DUF1499 family)